MTDVNDLQAVKSVLREVEEENPDLFYELPYLDGGTLTESGEYDVPEGWTITVYETHTEREYDSYGYASTEDGFVILKVTDGVAEALYRLPVNYASFSGWDVNLNGLTKTEKKEKVVTTWEWTRG